MWPLINSIYAHRDKLRYISALNETNIALVAEGYSRATRRPAFVNVYHSSGTALAMVALSVAWADHSPLILSTTIGGRATNTRDQYAAVPRSITEMTTQYTKWSFEVPLTQRIPEAIKRAVVTATTPPFGPVHLSFPMDLYDELVDSSTIPTRKHMPRIFVSSADQIGIEEAAVSLSKGSYPLILAGSEIGQHDALDELVVLSEWLNAPVIMENGTPPYLSFPTDHRLFAGKLNDNIDILQKADTILLIGFEATEGGIWDNEYPFRNSEQFFIQVTSTGSEICKQYTPNIALIGSTKIILGQLAKAIEKLLGFKKIQSKWNDSSDKWTHRTQKLSREMCSAMSNFGGDILEELISSLRKEFGSNLTLVDHSNSAHPYIQSVPFRTKDDYFSISQKGSAQGWGLPAAIGIQLALPKRNVLLVIGDGGFMFTSSSLYTAAKHKIPMVAIVLDNGGYDGGQYYLKVKDGTRGEFFLGDFSTPSINPAALAESLGVASYRLTSRSDVKIALERFHSNGGPFLFDVVLASRFVDAFRLHWKSAGGMLP